MASILQMTAWEDEAYPSKNDLLAVPLFALLFPAVRLFLDTLVLERLGRWLVLGSKKGLNENQIEDLKKRRRKFKESAWKLLYYFVAESLALIVTYNEPWFTSTRNFWVGPGDQIWPDQKVKTKLKLLYMYVAGFYAYSIVALVFWETRRSDFGVSMSHHVATLILILASYLLSYEVILCIDTKKHKGEGPIYYYIFNTLLICLLVLHIYWWVLIYRMLERQMKARGNISEDVRSDSEDDKED